MLLADSFGDLRLDTSWAERFEPLLGTDEATLDDKCRILFSKKKRDRLGDKFTVAVGTVGCLVAYPQAVWSQMIKGVLQIDPTNLGREIYTRLVLGQADDELRFDPQGRVVVPQKLRDLAKIKEKGQVLIVGCGDRVEIWAREEYDKYLKDPESYGQERRETLVKAKQMMREE